MEIIVDSREQAPLRFAGASRVEALPVGDYWCEYAQGSRPPVLFERKSLADLFGTMGRGYLRFKREVLAAKQQGWKLILLVEAPLAEVYGGTRHSSRPGEQIVQQVFTLWLRYGLQPVFCASREESAAFIQETYEAIGRNWQAGAGKVATAELFGGLQLPFVEYD